MPRVPGIIYHLEQYHGWSGIFSLSKDDIDRHTQKAFDQHRRDHLKNDIKVPHTHSKNAVRTGPTIIYKIAGLPTIDKKDLWRLRINP